MCNTGHWQPERLGLRLGPPAAAAAAAGVGAEVRVDVD